MSPARLRLRTYERRVAGMLADPDCVGELLLVGIALARGVDLDSPAPLGPDFSLRDVGIALYGPREIGADLAVPYGPGGPSRPARYPERGYRRIRSVVLADARRYEPPGTFHTVACARPRVRTEGVCGRGASANHTRRLTDPVTGERPYVGACTRPACRAWFEALVARNREECREHPPPVPPANTGGVLDRHLPEIDWYGLWSALDPSWSPPPEGRRFAPPTLTLLVGDDDQGDTAVPATPPVLTVLPGGWR